MSSNLKVAIVHDWLNQLGGAECVLEEMVTLFPQADIFTSIYASEKMPAFYQEWPIHTSFMQRLPGITNQHQPYMPVYPLAFRQFHLDKYDVVLSNKSGFCHGVDAGNTRNKNAGPIHICYCLTPTRFLWSFEQYQTRENIGTIANFLLRPLMPALQKWDYRAAQRVDFFVAISKEVQRRIKQIYGRESTIIYPPVDTEYFSLPSAPPNGREAAHEELKCKLPDGVLTKDYYLIVSRLIPYKRIDLAVSAFAHLPGERLLIVGNGRDSSALESMATENVHFLGRLERPQIRELLRHCKAFIFPGLEDFGIAPVEAMSSGRPVIAYAGGGALDTIIPGVSGELFHEQTSKSLLEVLQAFNPDDYFSDACHNQAKKFSITTFRTQLSQYIESVTI